MASERIYSRNSTPTRVGWRAGGSLSPRLGLSIAVVLFCAASVIAQSGSASNTATSSLSRVVVVHDRDATDAFVPRPDKVRQMVQRGLTNLTAKPTVAEAWRSLVSPKDIVGIKVFTSPSGDAGTRVVVVEAVIEGLLQAKLAPTNIIIWDKQRADLRRAGFMELAARHGVRVEGSANAGYDEQTAYSPERPIPSQLIWGDLEFGSKTEGAGRRSFVSKLVSRGMTKIITITPLLNHNTAGVSGHLYSLALGSVDNSIRFEHDLYRLSAVVPEIYAMPALSDHVVLNITDALICQYQGEQIGMLHYSTPLNELRFSRDPVALDYLSLLDLERIRSQASASSPQEYSLKNRLELLQNATLLELGASEQNQIKIDHLR